MGLAEKRAVEEFKNNGYTQFTSKLKEITKDEIVVETQWDKLSTAIEGYSDPQESITTYFTNMFGETILKSFQSICSDEMGRQALIGKVKRIQLTHTEDASSHGAGFKLNDNTLSLDMKFANVSEVQDRVEEMTKFLEKQL